MICRLCGKSFLISEMSEEHYPAHSVGNDDIVKLDLVKMIDIVPPIKPCQNQAA